MVGLAPGQRVADGGAYRILVVEDREASRVLLVQLLTTVGFEVREAINGQEAVAVWEAWKPHLVWMDMRMPVMDGYEATRRIKPKAQKLVPSASSGQALSQSKGRKPKIETVIIALTAHAFEEERAAILAAGCDDFVRKPFQEAEIFAKMAEHLGVRYVYEELAPPDERAGDTQLQTALTPADLVVLPSDWVADLRQAAMQGEVEWLLELVDQIESEYTLLARVSTQLVHEFRFDKIVALTESQTN